MIESVQARQRGAYDFESHYDNLCALQDSVPLPAVKAHLSSGVLDINADRVRATDWMPVLNTLQINKSLEYVAVRSSFQPQSDNDDKKSAIMKRKTPAIRSKEITFRLCKALKDCLFVSPTLRYVELQGLPLRDGDLQALTKGIMKNTAISHLSLEYCRIGDSGLEILCKGVKNSSNVSSINLTGCSLSARGAELIAKIIKHQGMRRHTEAWRDSLRYGQPDLDKMAGLRRININNNPLVGNQGAQVLAEALKDDLWVKALDMQATGVSTAGAKAFLDVLKYNTTLVVLDLRRNPLIERSLLHSVMEQLMINCSGQETEYQWIEPEEDQPAKQQKTKRRATKVLNNSAGRKTIIKVSPVSAKRWSRSLSAVRISRKAILESMKPTRGLPWRTAARANRFRGFPPERTPCKATDDTSEEDTSILITHEDSYAEKLLDAEDNFNQKDSDPILADIQTHQQLRELRVELEQLRRSVENEKLARVEADRRVLHLKLENRKLQDELHLQRLKNELEVGNAGEAERQNESVLESIEASFKMFHAFLDMLQEAGLGELITMAGLDQRQMGFSSNKPTVPPTSGETSSLAFASLAHSFKTGASAGAPVFEIDPDKEPTALHTSMKMPRQRENLQPVINAKTNQKGEIERSMSHINKDAYMAEKHAADKLYERLVQHTSGVFSSKGVSNTSGVSSRVLGSISAVPKEVPGEALTEHAPSLSPSPRDDHYTSLEHLAVMQQDPSLLQNLAKPEKRAEETLERPVPTPRHKTSHGTGWEKKDILDARDDTTGISNDRRVPSRASEASYSMDSFERSYVTENGEVVVLGEDDLPHSQSLNHSREDEF